MADVVDRMMRYESGDMDQAEIITFFQELVDTGLVSQLQGSYQRMAARLVADGLIRPRPVNDLDIRRFIRRLNQLTSEGATIIAKSKTGVLPPDAALEQLASIKVRSLAIVKEMLRAGWRPPEGLFPAQPSDVYTITTADGVNADHIRRKVGDVLTGPFNCPVCRKDGTTGIYQGVTPEAPIPWACPTCSILRAPSPPDPFRVDEDPAEIERRDHEKRQQAIEDRHQDERGER